jgi:peroxin-12
MAAAQSGAFRGAGVISQQEQTLPSIFDIWAQQSLADSVKPAFKHLVKFMGIWYPKETKSVNAWFDELYLGFSLFLETYYLKNYGGSVSENFYGMKRISPSSLKTPIGKDRLKSMFFVSVWPYLRGKLDDLQTKLSEVAEARRTNIAKFFLKYYPYFKTLLGAAAILFQIAYIFNYSTVPTPFLWAANSKLVKLTPEDLLRFESIPLHLQDSGLLTKLWRFIISIPSVFGRLFTYGLFFVQFLEFFYASDAAKELSTAHQRSQPPTHPVMKLTEPEILTMEVDKCPLCFRRRINDTVLSVSGYIFCYTCIDSYIRREGLCPITYLPATTDQLIRLYKE